MNNLKTIIIHIGPHKTGTTTLQNALYINREFLLSNDIFIPCAGRRNIKSAAHHNLAWELLKDSAYRPEYGNWENLIREVESCQQKTIII